MAETQPLLAVSDLKMHFPIRKGILYRVVGYVRAVDGVSFHLHRGETVGLVGESGCGKTTLARAVIRLYKPTEGKIHLTRDDKTYDLAELNRRQLKPLRRHIQYIFQDPYSSLNARMTVQRVVAEPLIVNGVGSPQSRRERAAELLKRVGLDESMVNRFPNEFSGGQRQRIVVARALALNPEIILCDEPVSALDVSIRAEVLNLLRKLQQEFGLSYLVIAHDMSVVDYVSERIMVMYLGRIVEEGSRETIYTRPRHPYTEALLSSIPVADPKVRRRGKPLGGGVPDPSNPPKGCHFHPRCPYAIEECREVDPRLEPTEEDPEVKVACIRAEDIELEGIPEAHAKRRREMRELRTREATDAR